jgi:hypothetical protein
MRNLSRVSKADQKAAAEYQAKRDAEKSGPRPRSKNEIPPQTSIRTDADRKAEDKALRDLMRPKARR